jgi:hypothetical protein
MGRAETGGVAAGGGDAIQGGRRRGGSAHEVGALTEGIGYVILISYQWRLNGKLANMPINYMEYGGELWV